MPGIKRFDLASPLNRDVNRNSQGRGGRVGFGGAGDNISSLLSHLPGKGKQREALAPLPGYAPVTLLVHQLPTLTNRLIHNNTKHATQGE